MSVGALILFELFAPASGDPFETIAGLSFNSWLFGGTSPTRPKADRDVRKLGRNAKIGKIKTRTGANSDGRQLGRMPTRTDANSDGLSKLLCFIENSKIP